MKFVTIDNLNSSKTLQSVNLTFWNIISMTIFWHPGLRIDASSTEFSSVWRFDYVTLATYLIGLRGPDFMSPRVKEKWSPFLSTPVIRTEIHIYRCFYIYPIRVTDACFICIKVKVRNWTEYLNKNSSEYPLVLFEQPSTTLHRYV